MTKELPEQGRKEAAPTDPAKHPAFEPIEGDLTGRQVLMNWLIMAAFLAAIGLGGHWIMEAVNHP